MVRQRHWPGDIRLAEALKIHKRLVRTSNILSSQDSTGMAEQSGDGWSKSRGSYTAVDE